MRRPLLTFLVLALAAFGGAQIIGKLVKAVGVGVVVKQYGGQINGALNRLVKHQDSKAVTTKVVPIVTLGVASRNSVGAAQVMGPADRIARVGSVAQLDQDILGREIKIRALVPIEGNDPRQLRRVQGVGVSGTVDLRL